MNLAALLFQLRLWVLWAGIAWNQDARQFEVRSLNWNLDACEYSIQHVDFGYCMTVTESQKVVPAPGRRLLRDVVGRISPLAP